MKFKLYKVSGYEEAIMALRMSKGKFYSEKAAKDIRELVWLVTDDSGFICDECEYLEKYNLIDLDMENEKITGHYEKDIAEFKRLLGLTMDNAMGKFKHHTLMKYIDISFFSEGLHRGAQDDLDSHAIAFNNRITRFSTRLAEISENNLSEFYQGKVLTFDDVNKDLFEHNFMAFPKEYDNNGEKFIRTPFGYVHEKYAQFPAKNGRDKDVQRGLMPLGMASNAIWKSDMFNLRYVYKTRSQFTKTAPELKDGMEQLADQIEENIPVFGEFFRKELTDSGEWEHLSKVKTVSNDEYQEFKKWRAKNKELQELFKKNTNLGVWVTDENSST